MEIKWSHLKKLTLEVGIFYKKCIFETIIRFTLAAEVGSLEIKIFLANFNGMECLSQTTISF